MCNWSRVTEQPYIKVGAGKDHHTATSIAYPTQSLNFTTNLTNNTWSYGGNDTNTKQTQSTVTLTITAYDKSSSSTTRIPVTNTTETSPTGSGGLPKGLTLDTTKGTITGSIDTGVTPGEYVAIITVTYSNASNSKTEVSPVLPSNSSSVHALTSPSRTAYPQALP